MRMGPVISLTTTAHHGVGLAFRHDGRRMSSRRQSHTARPRIISFWRAFVEGSSATKKADYYEYAKRKHYLYRHVAAFAGDVSGRVMIRRCSAPMPRAHARCHRHHWLMMKGQPRWDFLLGAAAAATFCRRSQRRVDAAPGIVKAAQSAAIIAARLHIARAHCRFLRISGHLAVPGPSRPPKRIGRRFRLAAR